MGTALQVKLLQDCPSVLCELARWFADQWGKSDPLDEFEPSVVRLKDHLASAAPLPFTLVGFDNGEPVATACLQESMVAIKRPYGPWVAYVYVPPDIRGSGAGSKIMQALEEESVKRGFGTLYLHTYRAEPFYQKLGWQTIERLTDPAGAVMTKTISGCAAD